MIKQNRNSPIDIENKLMVAQVEGVGGGNKIFFLICKNLTTSDPGPRGGDIVLSFLLRPSCAPGCRQPGQSGKGKNR